MTNLYNELDAANHSVSYTAHLMEIDPCDATIASYESALDYAASVRKAIGEANRVELARLDMEACR